MTRISFDPNAKSFPLRKDLPRAEGVPEGASWFWGEHDQLGRLNLLTPARVAASAKEIQTGEMIPLNLPLDTPKVPAFAREQFQHRIKTLAPGIAYDDVYELNTQSSTQFDGFRHFSIVSEGLFYNGATGDDIVGEHANDKCSIQHWAKHGIAGRGVLLDYWSYAEKKGTTYDAMDHYEISYAELEACGRDQGIDIRPEAQGGDIKIGDILFVRSGFTVAYNSNTDELRAARASRPHVFGVDDGQRWPGLRQEPRILDFLHDCYFAAVAGDAPSFEAWPCLVDEGEAGYLHESILGRWGMPLGELFDLEKLAETCRKRGRWTFFVTSSPNNCPRGVSTHGNALAIF